MPRTASVVLAALSAVLAAASVRVSAQAALQEGTAAAVVLVTSYPGERTTHTVVTSTPRISWTPYFPRLQDAQPAPGELPVTGIKYRKVLADDGRVVVDISVLRGGAQQQEQSVGRIVVRRGERVVVDALSAVGVAPITLSLTALTPATLYPPQVRNQTAGLEVVNIEITEEPTPRYHITVRNLSTQPAINFHFVTYRDERRGLSGSRGHRDASPLIAPGEVYSFALDPAGGEPAANGGWTPSAHDVFEITSVLWEDGRIEGDPAPMVASLSAYAGRAAQLARGIALLEAPDTSADPEKAARQLRARIEQLPIEPDAATLARARERLRHLEPIDEQVVIAQLRWALGFVRNGMLDDLDDAPKEPAAFQRWRAEIVGLYRQWHDRFSTR